MVVGLERGRWWWWWRLRGENGVERGEGREGGGVYEAAP